MRCAAYCALAVGSAASSRGTSSALGAVGFSRATTSWVAPRRARACVDCSALSRGSRSSVSGQFALRSIFAPVRRQSLGLTVECQQSGLELLPGRWVGSMIAPWCPPPKGRRRARGATFVGSRARGDADDSTRGRIDRDSFWDKRIRCGQLPAL